MEKVGKPLRVLLSARRGERLRVDFFDIFGQLPGRDHTVRNFFFHALRGEPGPGIGQHRRRTVIVVEIYMIEQHGDRIAHIRASDFSDKLQAAAAACNGRANRLFHAVAVKVRRPEKIGAAYFNAPEQIPAFQNKTALSGNDQKIHPGGEASVREAEIPEHKHRDMAVFKLYGHLILCPEFGGEEF
ncbi:hypothetical protein SDC9_124377 [bioreactor metagenome]|uniref:Uncharacterized protein n=1 Tax=bioreactor metagenome TaxID=1076179 RepID=A0A645CKA6_9ZZZZ